jgi:hypothetical protein
MINILKREAKILLIIDAFDSLILGWVNVWWILVFLQAVEHNVIPINNALMPLGSMFGMVYVIKKFPKPTFKSLFFVAAFSYLPLLFLFLSLESFILASTIMSAMYASMSTVFNNRIRALNVPDPEERARYDDVSQLVRNGMTFIGSLMSYIIIYLNVPIWLSWVIIFVLFDLDNITKYILVRRGVFVYSDD